MLSIGHKIYNESWNHIRKRRQSKFYLHNISFSLPRLLIHFVSIFEGRKIASWMYCILKIRTNYAHKYPWHYRPMECGLFAPLFLHFRFRHLIHAILCCCCCCCFSYYMYVVYYCIIICWSELLGLHSLVCILLSFQQSTFFCFPFIQFIFFD